MLLVSAAALAVLSSFLFQSMSTYPSTQSISTTTPCCNNCCALIMILLESQWPDPGALCHGSLINIYVSVYMRILVHWVVTDYEMPPLPIVPFLKAMLRASSTA